MSLPEPTSLETAPARSPASALWGRARRPLAVVASLIALYNGLLFVTQLWSGSASSGRALQAELGRAMLWAACAVLLAWGLRPAARRFVVGFLCAAVLLSNGRQIGSSDNFPAYALPFQIARSGTVTYDDFPCFVWPERYLVKVGGHQYSQYPLTIGFLALPISLPAVLGHFDPCADEGMAQLAKISGALLTSIGVALLSEVFVALAGGTGWGLLATAVYVLGTAVLSLLGQSLFQHTGAVLGLSIAAFGMFRARPALAPWLVGFGASLAVASRSFDVFVAAGFVVAYVSKDWKRLPRVVVAGLFPVGLVVAYQAVVFGSPFATGYGADATNGWHAHWFEGIAGEFFSPARGLFVFSPVLLLALRSFFSASVPESRRIRILGVGALVHVAVMAKWWAWHGAWCNSSRMVSDTLPVFGIALAAALPWIVANRLRFAGFAALAMLSILPHVVVAYSGFDRGPLRTYTYDLSEGPWSLRAYPPVARLLPASNAPE